MPQISTTRTCLVVLATLLFIFPPSVVAIPIADYHQNLKRAITALDTLNQSDEAESSSDYESRFQHTIESVRTALPEHQTVESPEGTCEIDNSWLHKELKDVADRPEKLKELLERLQAIETRIAERQDSVPLVESKDQANSRLKTILARPEYATGARGPNAFARLLQDLIRWLQKLFPKRAPADPGRVSWVSRIALVFVVLAALFMLGYVLKLLLTRVKRSRKYKTPKKRKAQIVLGERLEPEETASDLLSEAEALARNGDLRAAIRKAYIALLVELGDRKLISLAQHKTNRDYLNSVRNVPQLHSRMRGLTDSFERHWYGFAQATPNDWQDFRAGYLAVLQTGN
jgi:hypothetical protein